MIPEERPDPTVADRYVETDSGNIFTRTWTPAPGGVAERAPILLFHDSIGAVALWRDFPARLAEASGHQVIAYDRLGFGQSSARTARPPLSFVTEEAQHIVPALCTGLGLDRLIPCGHSVGGGMAVETAARYPSLCQAVVTLAAQAFVEDRTLSGIREAKAAFADPAQLQRLSKYHGEKARWVVDAWTETWLSPGFASWNLDEALETMACPLLAVHGADDEYGTAVHPERLSRGSGRQMLLLPDTGHVPHRERPGPVLDTIAGFLSALLASRTAPALK